MHTPSSSNNFRKHLRIGLLIFVATSSAFTYWMYQRTHPAQPVTVPVAELPIAKNQNANKWGTMTPEQELATRTAKPCDKTIITNLDLSRFPTEAELIAAGNLGEKLTPTRSADASKITDPAARKRQELDNLAFGTAIQAWNDHRYDDAEKLFADHLRDFPDSPWAAESMLHLGCKNQYVARFTDSKEWFDKILATAPHDTEMYHKAKLRRTILNIDLGKLDDATTGFGEMMKEDPDADHQSYASYWLMQTAFLKKNEAALRDCGQKALSKAARILGNESLANSLFQRASAGSHGFTALELHTLALESGLTSVPVRADAALDALPTPFIAHYKDRHYVTVESVNADTVTLYDSRISAETQMNRVSFEKEWSGFALLMKEIPPTDGIHPAENLERIIGGCCGQPTQISDLGKTGCEDCNGLPGHSVNPINMNFTVVDTPMWWEPPVGPAVKHTLVFNSQDSLNNYEPFGPKWSFEYVSYLLITPGQRVQVKDGDGQLETFPAPVGGGTYPLTYQSPAGDFRVMTQTALHDFSLTLQDGTVYQYGIPTAMQGNSSVPLLLSITDRHNNSLSITHNANGAITAVSHSALTTGSWSFIYELINGTYSRVTRIDDPFNRSCYFSYDSSGRLTSQIDMGGLPYSYGYTTKNAIDNTLDIRGGQNPQNTAVPQLFINAITTPTGTTQINTEPAEGNSSLTHTQAEMDAGYWAGYPASGKNMWTNYRITLSDHLNHPSEYFFCGYNSQRYYRNAKQLSRPPGTTVRPDYAGRKTMVSNLIGGKGEITSVIVYDETNAQVSSSSSSGHDSITRLPSIVSSGHGLDHHITYNSQGRPTIVIPNEDYSNEDSQINYTYMPNGVDVDTVKRKWLGVEKTLIDYNYFPNSRDVQSVTQLAYNGTTETTRTLTFTWKTNGLPLTVTDSMTSDVVAFEYDANERPTTVKVNNVSMGMTSYDVKGTLLSSMSPDGDLSYFEYDNLNRLTKETNADNSFTAYQWACCFIEQTRYGKMNGSTEQTLRRTATMHDARALPLFTVDSDGSKISFTYDIAGDLTKITDQNNKTTEWVLDALGRATKKIFPDNSQELYRYDGYNRVDKITNRRGQEVTMEYNSNGDLYLTSSTSHPQYSSYQIQNTYDSWNRLLTSSAQGQPVTGNTVTHTTSYTLDLLDRITSIDGPFTDDTISWSYQDAARQVTRTAPGAITQTSTVDAYGRMISVANQLGIFTNTYASIGGPLTAITHTGANAGFNSAFTYFDADYKKALQSITSTKGATITGKHTYSYDSLGQIKTWKREAPLANPTGATNEYLSSIYYNQSDQLQAVINTPVGSNSAPETAHHFSSDAAGNIKSQQTNATTTGVALASYSHNNLNQLNGQSADGAVLVRGSTDESAMVKMKTSLATEWKNARLLEGNIFEKELDLITGGNTINVQATDGSNNTSLYNYNITLATPAAANTYTYDADGNLLSDGIRSYTWDCFSRLVSIAWGGGSNKTTSYLYNAQGQRCEQIEKTGTTETAHFYYLYDGIQLLARYTGGTTLSNIDRRYTAQGEQRKISSTWQSYYYSRDHLGSIREVLNADGSLAARYDYTPYGQRLTRYQAASYPTCDLGFTGHITQPSPVANQKELVLTLYRIYDPTTARWLSPDPLGEEGGLNLYQYCLGDPVNRTDIYGLDAAWWAEFFRVLGENLTDPKAHLEAWDNTRPGFGSRNPKKLRDKCHDKGSGYTPQTPAPAKYPKDYQTKSTKQQSAGFSSEGEARQLAREKVGKDPVDIGDNKLRSKDGKWQYRAKPGDTADDHVHLEKLDPTTGEVLENWHLNYPKDCAR